MELLRNDTHASEIQGILEDNISRYPEGATPGESRMESMVQEIMSGETAESPTVIMWTKRLAAAAAIAAVALIAYWAFNRNITSMQTNLLVASKAQPDINPGSSKAVLTLGNGSEIMLDSAATGKIAQEGEAKIIKTAGGQINYNISDPNPAAAVKVEYNVLTTPRGGQYKLLLPDGSLVWLNAASSIRYPTVFTGISREVAVTGEVYFEVAKQKKIFVVSMPDGSDVQVLGTHFNVNAYKDDGNIKTTLLEGSVKIVTASDSVIIKPGEQAQVRSGMSRDIRILPDADMDNVMAWKNGLISFKGADIKSIMKLIERWYDVDVVYQGNVPERTFVGEAESTVKLSEMLRILKLNNINFKVEGRKIIVIP